MILDDDAQQSEGDRGAIKQPIVPVHSAPQSSSDLSPPGGSRGVELHQTSPRDGVRGGDSGSNVFVPTWSLQNESRLSVHTNTVEFANHEFSPIVVANTEAVGSPTLSHNMSYTAAPTMFYLVASARRIQLPNEMEASHSGCGVQEASQKCQNTELENDVHGFEQKCALLASEKAVVEEV